MRSSSTATVTTQPCGRSRSERRERLSRPRFSKTRLTAYVVSPRMETLPSMTAAAATRPLRLKTRGIRNCALGFCRAHTSRRALLSPTDILRHEVHTEHIRKAAIARPRTGVTSRQSNHSKSHSMHWPINGSSWYIAKLSLSCYHLITQHGECRKNIVCINAAKHAVPSSTAGCPKIDSHFGIIPQSLLEKRRNWAVCCTFFAISLLFPRQQSHVSGECFRRINCCIVQRGRCFESLLRRETDTKTGPTYSFWGDLFRLGI